MTPHDPTSTPPPPPQDVQLVVCQVFSQRCALTGVRLRDPSRARFCLTWYDESKPPLLRNVIFCTEAAAAMLREGGGPKALPAPLRERVAEVQKTSRPPHPNPHP